MSAKLVWPLFVLLLATGASCRGDSEKPRDAASRNTMRPEIGNQVPDYSATSLTGGPESLTALRGKVVLLNVWATWCIPCRTELPDLQAMHAQYASKGLALIGVSIDASADAENVKAFASERGVTYALWLDADDRVSGTFFAQGVPATYLIGRDGTLRFRWLGPLKHDVPGFNEAMQKALAE